MSKSAADLSKGLQWCIACFADVPPLKICDAFDERVRFVERMKVTSRVQLEHHGCILYDFSYLGG